MLGRHIKMLITRGELKPSVSQRYIRYDAVDSGGVRVSEATDARELDSRPNGLSFVDIPSSELVIGPRELLTDDDRAAYADDANTGRR